MRASKELVAMRAIFCVVLMVFLVGGILVPRPVAAIAPAGSCDVVFFSKLDLPNPNTVFTCPAPYTACTVSPQSAPIGHCEIIGYINPRTGVDGKPYAIGFHLRLPDNWNGRFYFQGGGGTDGSLGDALGGGVLSVGYAVVSTDGGHDNTIDNDLNAGGTAAFGVDPQARSDYGYNAVDQVTQTAKSIIKEYYKSDIAYSYFVGCSNGGRQGMVASRRFPTYFDGIVSGAPGFNLPKAGVAEAWNEQALAPLATKLSTNFQPYLVDTFSDGDLTLASNAILDACDGLDGLVDGIVDNYAPCTDEVVYPKLDALVCIGPKTNTCLSAGQVGALKKIYAGPNNSSGEILYTDWQWDPGISGFTSLRMWSLGSPFFGPPGANTAFNLTLGGGAVPLVFVTPPAVTPATGLEGYIFGFNFDTDAPKIFQTAGIYTESSMQFMTPPAPETELSAFRDNGGKMILYHGNSDGVFSPHDTINWYDEMSASMGEKVPGFARLFLVPGMGHCGGGPGTTQFDAFTPLVNWVEYGNAPERIAATAPAGTPWTGRIRPLCPYPGFAKYIGTGNIDKAENFICAFPTDVRIEPEVLKLNKGTFTAFITVPDIYEGKNLEIINAVCEGASATEVSLIGRGRTLIAKFNRQDLKNEPLGKSVPFRVTVIVEYKGNQIAFEGNDTVRVVK